MGDRANVVMKRGAEKVCLYTHWNGTELPETLRAALIRGEDRWTDNQYLARIIFCEMVKGHEMKTTGFGISQEICDGEYRVLTVDTEAGTVSVNASRTLTFQEFVATEQTW